MTSGSDARRIAAAGAVFVLAALFRLSTASMTNDDFLHLTLAQQVLLGDVPFRDFIDAGEFLFYHLSAAVQLVFGRHLLSEVLLDVLLLSAGYALVFLLAARASGSLLIGGFATAFTILLMPRLYSYPKIFLYAVGLHLIWRYVDRPTTRALLLLSLWTTVAFLFRHDHGVALGVASALTIGMVHWDRAWGMPARRVLSFAAAVVVLLAPFLVFVHRNGGLVTYWQNTVVTGRAEYERTVGPYPRFQPRLASPRINVRWSDGIEVGERRGLEDRFRLAAGEQVRNRTWSYELTNASRENVAALVEHPAVEDTAGVDRSAFTVTVPVSEPNVLAWFYYLTVLLPPLAGLALVRQPAVARLQAADRTKVVATVALAALMFPFLLRAASLSAVADVGVVTAVLGAWLLRRAGTLVSGGAGWPRARVALTTAIVVVTVAALSKSDGVYALGLAVGSAGQEPSFGERIDALRRATAPSDDPAAQYVFHCTSEDDRLLVTGYAPDLYVKSGRGFAAGRPYFLSTLGAPEHEQFSMDRLARQRVPLVLTRSDVTDDLRAFPAIQDYVRRQYRQAGEIAFVDATYTVLVDVRIPPRCTYGDARLPCFGPCAGGGE